MCEETSCVFSDATAGPAGSCRSTIRTPSPGRVKSRRGGSRATLPADEHWLDVLRTPNCPAKRGPEAPRRRRTSPPQIRQGDSRVPVSARERSNTISSRRERAKSGPHRDDRRGGVNPVGRYALADEDAGAAPSLEEPKWWESAAQEFRRERSQPSTSRPTPLPLLRCRASELRPGRAM